MSAIPTNSSTETPETNVFGAHPYRLPDAAWMEMEKYIPPDARIRMPLIRDWIERAGSPGLAGDTELHLHIARSIIQATGRNAKYTEHHLKLFLESHAALIIQIVENATSIAETLPKLDKSLGLLNEANTQAAANMETVLQQFEMERKEHEETLRQLIDKINAIHQDFYVTQITPLLDFILRMPGYLAAIDEKQRKTNFLVCVFGSIMVSLPIIFIIVVMVATN